MEKLNQWYISHYDKNGDLISIKHYQVFNKDQIQKDFDIMAKQLKEGEELWFQLDNKKYIGETILVVCNKNNKIMREVSKSNKTFYKNYNFIY